MPLSLTSSLSTFIEALPDLCWNYLCDQFHNMFSSLGAFALLLSTALGQGYANDNSTGGYVLKQGPLDTPWTTTVGTNSWPEYPRPQLARSNPEQWKNLNGVWEYKNSTKNEYEGLSGVSVGGELEGGQAVLVPFCLESALSGM